MSVEIANVIQAMVSIRSDASTGVQLMAGAGVIAASLTRVSTGVYTIDLEQPLSKDVSAFPAQGHVDYLLSPNIEEGTVDWDVTAELIAGAVVGVFDRLRLVVTVAGVADDPAADAPFSCIVFRFPSIG